MAHPEDYAKAFDGEFKNRDAYIVNAFEKAVDTRKFEIELYWKRAAYFWTLIAAALAGYFVIQSADRIPDRRLFSFVISCIGFTFTLAWFFVNKGSKFWQENWENHVDLLSERVVGPLYRWVLHRPAGQRSSFFGVTDPAPISVSKINQWVSLYVLLIWVFLMSLAMPLGGCPCSCSAALKQHPYLLVLGMTVAAALAMWGGAKTNLNSHSPELTKMEIKIRD